VPDNKVCGNEGKGFRGVELRTQVASNGLSLFISGLFRGPWAREWVRVMGFTFVDMMGGWMDGWMNM
jgi:hypothetical protein